jgi:hypothetical protein
MDTHYTELFFVFGMMAFVLIVGTIGLILFVKYLNREKKEAESQRERKNL